MQTSVFQVLNWNKCPLRIPIFHSSFGDDNLFGFSSPFLKEVIHRMNATLEFMPVSGVGTICGPGERTGARGTVVRAWFQLIKTYQH